MTYAERFWAKVNKDGPVVRRSAGVPVADIALRYGVCASAVYHLTNGRNWKCLRRGEGPTVVKS